MLITFKTKSYANITLFGDVAENMLKMMNFGATVPGAIVAKDVAKALENLKSSLEAVPDIAPPPADENDDQTTVSLHARAIPLIELLESAIQDRNDIRWM